MIFTAVNSVAQQTPITGALGVDFGQTESVVLQKLNTMFPGRTQKIDGGILVKDVKLGDEHFEGVQFLFNYNKLSGIIFSNLLDYKKSYTDPLTHKQAQQWLDSNRRTIQHNIDKHVIEMLKTKYGNPITGSSDAYAFWKDNNGNFIEIMIEEYLDISTDPNFTQKYGAYPAFRVNVAYIQNQGNNQF